MMDLLLEQDGKVSIVFFHMAGSDVEQVLGWERSLIASDSLHEQAEKPHPRLYGAFPHVLATYEDPKHFPEGISHVLVNGARMVESGALMETGEGKVIGRENR